MWRRQTITLFTLYLLSGAVQATTASQQSLGSTVYQTLTEAHALIERAQQTEALARLQALLESKALNDYERAIILQLIGQAHYTQGQYRLAIQALKQALKTSQLPVKQAQPLYYQLAQLLIQQQDYQAARHYLEKWFQNEAEPSAAAHILAAAAYYYLGEHQQAIPQAEQAISKGESIPQGWYALLLDSYHETQNHHKAIPILKKLIRTYPDTKRFWMQLISAYHATKQPIQALASHRLAYQKGVLEQADIIQLAEHYLSQTLPYQAAQLLQTAIDSQQLEASAETLLLLADSWLLAREDRRAEQTLQQLVRLPTPPARAYRLLAQIHIDSGHWEAAYTLLSPFSHTPPAGHAAPIYLYLGISAFHLARYEESSLALNKALSDPQLHAQAKWWLQRIKTANSRAP